MVNGQMTKASETNGYAPPLPLTVHEVVGPHTPLVSVAVHAIPHMVYVAILDVAVNVNVVE